MPRHLVNLLNFTRTTGHPCPHLRAAVDTYAWLLVAMGRSRAEVLAEINAVAEPYGMSFGSG